MYSRRAQFLEIDNIGAIDLSFICRVGLVGPSDYSYQITFQNDNTLRVSENQLPRKDLMAMLPKFHTDHEELV